MVLLNKLYMEITHFSTCEQSPVDQNTVAYQIKLKHFL